MPSTIPSKIPVGPSIGDSFTDIVAVTYDLIVDNAPQRIADALDRSDVQAGIQKAIAEWELKNRVPDIGQQSLTKKQATDLLQILQKDVGPRLSDDLIKQIMNTQDYQRLMSALKTFEQALRTSQLGIFYSDNKLVCIGLAVSLAGGLSFFLTTSKSPVVKKLADLLPNDPKLNFDLGTISIGAGITKYQSKFGYLGTSLSVTKDWKSLGVKTTVNVIVQGDHIVQVGGTFVYTSGKAAITAKGTFDTPTDIWHMNLAYKPDTDRGKWELGLGFGGQNGQLNQIQGTAGYKIDENFSLDGSGGKDGKGFSTMVHLTGHF